MSELLWSIDHPDLVVGLVFAEGVTVGPMSDEGTALISARVAAVKEDPEGSPNGPRETTRQAMRKLLKHGGFKATGRNKPASEYLAEAKKRGEWPAILNVVDINNLLSLETGWPMSVLDADKCGAPLEVRFGKSDESYVFNQAGHSIDLAGLLGLARVDGPMLGNPVKDAMHAKVDASTTRLVVCMWTSRDACRIRQAQPVADDFADLLTRFAGARATRTAVQSA